MTYALILFGDQLKTLLRVGLAAPGSSSCLPPSQSRANVSAEE
jgi:hypothetical protein